MRTSVAAAARSMLRNSHDCDGLSPASIPINRLEHELTGAIQAGLSRAGLSNKEAAFLQGIDPAQWSRQLHGPEHPSLRRMLKLGPAFWQHFTPALALICDAPYGTDPRWTLLIELGRAIFTELRPSPARAARMLKADLPAAATKAAK